MSVNVRIQHISNYVYKCDISMITLEVVTIDCVIVMNCHNYPNKRYNTSYLAHYY